jgi:phage-related protein
VVKRQFGYALWLAQLGGKAPAAKPLGGNKEFRGARVLEIVADFDSDTYRAVSTVEFEEAVYVVDAFQKKSKKGIATPQKDIDRMVERIKALRIERQEPDKKAAIAQLNARRALRQQAIDEKRKKQKEPK